MVKSDVKVQSLAVMRILEEVDREPAKMHGKCSVEKLAGKEKATKCALSELILSKEEIRAI